MIKAESLTKRFDGFTALNGINCDIPKSCVYGMVGSNGAGKSTFLRLISGVYQPDGGSITIDGEQVFENPQIKSRIAYIADETFFLPGANLERMARFYAAGYKSFDMPYFKYLADKFNLSTKKPINSFSKGMKRQAAAILALCRRADYYLFDETFDGLDPVMRKTVRSLICEQVSEYSATAVITSHSLRELEDTCDQLALLHRGGVVLQSDVERLKTTLFKIQVAFNMEYGPEKFEDFDILNFKKNGSVINMIVRGDKEQTKTRLQLMKPILIDILPLTLEEVFTYEMAELGYAFSDQLTSGEDNAV
ncbi:MAG: ABC transporter ATP-binding protein [Oscillospiraceae bacterium]|nr:ABC transporter ATP-binding protein [Oscillospiraceae bacterium]